MEIFDQNIKKFAS